MRAALALALLLGAASAAAEIPQGAFVTVEGTRFVVAGRPFRFLGANVETLQGEQHRRDYERTLAEVARDGHRVIRVWAFGDGPAEAGEWHRRHELFRAGPEGFLEGAYQQLDRVLAAARARDLRVIVTLGNFWDDFGGLRQYLRWAGRGDDDRVAFYRDPQIRRWFEAALDRLLQRTNSVGGVAYVDDPTIFAWELMNESAVGSDEEAAARREWIVAMARYLKARDPHHLVAAGVAGYRSLEERRQWIEVHRLPEIDYCDSHLYPDQADAVATLRELDDRLADRVQLAHHVVGKPLVIGEYGFRTDRRRRPFGGPRSAAFAHLPERLFADGGAGALVWIYGPHDGRARDYGIYTDEPSTKDVRRALRRLAAALAKGRFGRPDRRLGPASGERPLYEAYVTHRRRGGPRGRWAATEEGHRLALPPSAYAVARFERVGLWERGALAHLYGVGDGEVSYRFPGPPSLPARFLIHARLSAEWPGTRGPPEGTSAIELRLDGRTVARFPVGADDGQGRVYTIPLDDPALLRGLVGGSHRLTFAVPPGTLAHGLCLYGAPTGHGPAPVDAIPIVLEAQGR